ncbi:hypothetical protein nbrc107696_10080 [Gordonia spumicola]|uniref:Prephenate dehydrogenase n=1 Tax=Gordonia spumicola TaxID=589161 RepID=A0A7I9V5T3_9ACTN|nr:hypothetical protein [Gordonia spumicola]GEE00562.1 hypothetical protein nbrc107696_10080 [Gordonia spumicola]
MSGVDADDWDIVVSTVPVTEPEVTDLLRAAGPDVVLAAVSQVPSEVEALREVAGDRRWAVITPEVMARTCGSVTRWWQPGAARFTVAEPLGGEIAQTLFGGERWAARGSVSSSLLSAAAAMPIVAALQAADFDFGNSRRALRSGAAAADEAGRAVAAAAGVDEPRSVNPVIMGVMLRALRVLAPFDVAEYFREHFGSHTRQTMTMLDDWIALARAHDLPAEALVTLRTDLSHATAMSSQRTNSAES